MKTTVLDMTGKAVGEIELNDAIFAVEPNVSVMHTVVKNYLANQRQGTQSALTRAEVSGGGKKPYRQKGTGRAQRCFQLVVCIGNKLFLLFIALCYRLHCPL